uniref:hypothetical protein n=2 Tax=Bradyrhizobium TaxID=374 RepID=UPI0004880AE6
SVAEFSGDAASRLATCNIGPCEVVTSDGGTESGAAALNPAATIALADNPVSNFVSMAGAGNAALAFARTVVTFSGMPLNPSATLAFGVAMLGRGTAI